MVLKEDTAITDVTGDPELLVGCWNKGIGEISSGGKSTGERCGGVGRLTRVEATAVGEPEKWWRVEFAKAAEERVPGDDMVERGVGG